MRVQVRLFSHYRDLLPAEARGQATVELSEGATVAELLDRLGVSGQVKLVTINNQPEANRRRTLRDGDSVRVFPPVVGG